jgi:UDP-N-acetylmuramyl pentapeptide phosphotransferase/UDP-N-acetylglucosamine-1-phosphate transferase
MLSFILMLYAIPNIFAVCYRKKLYDQPGGRRIHTTPVPRLGGMAFLPIICCTVILIVSLYIMVTPSYVLTSLRSVVWICPMILIFMTGVLDDLIGVRSLTKLFVQIVAGALVVWSGLWIDNLGGLFGIHTLPVWIGIPLTVLFVVLVINAMNLIDGADGLAAGLSIVSFVVYGIHCYLTGATLFPIIAAAVLGTLVPFFYVNVRGYGSRRHKLFMGDTGSQSMGLIIGIFAIALIMKSGRIPVRPNAILALSPLIVPVFDLVHVALFRLARGRHPFRPDMTHIHHRLLQKGFTPHQAVTLILCLATVYISGNMALAPRFDINLILALDLALWFLFNSRIVSYLRNTTPIKR